MRVRSFLLTLFFIVGLGGVGFLYKMNQVWQEPGPSAAEKIIYFPPQGGGRAIARQLQEQGVIDHPLYFRLFALLHRSQGPLQAGEYLFTPHMPLSDVIGLLQSGRTYQRKLTIPEGLMSFEIAQILNAAPAMTGTVTTDFAQGTLLPETYSYSYGEDKEKVLARMRQALRLELASLWTARDPSVFFATPIEAVILASIVEKETGVAHERARVAGVFLNRLRQGMPLQSDPTVAYAVTMGHVRLNRSLTRVDLNVNSPYNTYIYKGLPPAPIAHPGREALKAVLHPEMHRYLYFVADGQGGHVFSETLSEHNRNVARWRQLRDSR